MVRRIGAGEVEKQPLYFSLTQETSLMVITVYLRLNIQTKKHPPQVQGRVEHALSPSDETSDHLRLFQVVPGLVPGIHDWDRAARRHRGRGHAGRDGGGRRHCLKSPQSRAGCTAMPVVIPSDLVLFWFALCHRSNRDARRSSATATEPDAQARVVPSAGVARTHPHQAMESRFRSAPCISPASRLPAY